MKGIVRCMLWGILLVAPPSAIWLYLYLYVPARVPTIQEKVQALPIRDLVTERVFLHAMKGFKHNIGSDFLHWVNWKWDCWRWCDFYTPWDSEDDVLWEASIAIDYGIDLMHLTPEQFTWDGSSKLSIRLPPPRIVGIPALSNAHRVGQHTTRYPQSEAEYVYLDEVALASMQRDATQWVAAMDIDPQVRERARKAIVGIVRKLSGDKPIDVEVTFVDEGGAKK